ncbi:addiction module toxin, HicA family [Pseudomonas syringae]|nr:addiction module toxin, HicA family [Pseudomonas syringae]
MSVCHLRYFVGSVRCLYETGHHMFKHPQKAQTVPVPHPKKDLPVGTVKAIRKLAGLV